MSGNLSITAENGRGMKTYGVAGLAVSIMRIVFLCIVTGISCSARATEDIAAAYPGIRFGLPQGDQKPLEDDSIEDPRPYNFLGSILKPDSPWPDEVQLNHDRKLSHLSEKISESLRDILELIKQRKRRFPFKYHPPKYDSEEERNYAVEDYRASNGNNQGYYPYRLQNQRILEDYPPEDDDFSFRGGERELETDQEREREAKVDEEFSKFQSPLLEASGKGPLEEAEFAYSPFDPRYYQNSSSIARKPTLPPIPIKEGNKIISSDADEITEKIRVENRNEGGTVYDTRAESEEHQQQVDDSVQVVAVQPHSPEGDAAGVLIIAFVAGISAAATVGLIAFGIGWYNLQKHVKNASDVEYPAYGVTGPNKDVSPSGDRRLAQSAQMYHYQHQKQQIIAMESRNAAGDRHGSVSEADSDEENEEGDYTVYECPGLAPTGEMEVKNPLFQDDPTPAQTPATKSSGNGGNQKK